MNKELTDAMRNLLARMMHLEDDIENGRINGCPGFHVGPALSRFHRRNLSGPGSMPRRPSLRSTGTRSIFPQ